MGYFWDVVGKSRNNCWQVQDSSVVMIIEIQQTIGKSEQQSVIKWLSLTWDTSFITFSLNMESWEEVINMFITDSNSSILRSMSNKLSNSIDKWEQSTLSNNEFTLSISNISSISRHLIRCFGMKRCTLESLSLKLLVERLQCGVHEIVRSLSKVG